MRLEVLRSVAEHLAHSTLGVGAQLASVPRDAGDALPATPTIYEQSKNFATSMRSEPPTTPAIQVFLDASENLDPSRAQPVRDGIIRLVLRYLDRDNNGASGTQDWLYIARAIDWSLDRLTLPITRNNVQLYYITERSDAEPGQLTEDIWVLGGFRIGIQARDLTP